MNTTLILYYIRKRLPGAMQRCRGGFVQLQNRSGNLWHHTPATGQTGCADMPALLYLVVKQS